MLIIAWEFLSNKGFKGVGSLGLGCPEYTGLAQYTLGWGVRDGSITKGSHLAYGVCNWEKCRQGLDFHWW